MVYIFDKFFVENQISVCLSAWGGVKVMWRSLNYDMGKYNFCLMECWKI